MLVMESTGFSTHIIHKYILLEVILHRKDCVSFLIGHDCPCPLIKLVQLCPNRPFSKGQQRIISHACMLLSNVSSNIIFTIYFDYSLASCCGLGRYD